MQNRWEISEPVFVLIEDPLLGLACEIHGHREDLPEE